MEKPNIYTKPIAVMSEPDLVNFNLKLHFAYDAMVDRTSNPAVGTYDLKFRSWYESDADGEIMSIGWHITPKEIEEIASSYDAMRCTKRQQLAIHEAKKCYCKILLRLKEKVINEFETDNRRENYA